MNSVIIFNAFLMIMFFISISFSKIMEWSFHSCESSLQKNTSFCRYFNSSSLLLFFTRNSSAWRRLVCCIIIIAIQRWLGNQHVDIQCAACCEMQMSKGGKKDKKPCIKQIRKSKYYPWINKRPKIPPWLLSFVQIRIKR